MATLFKSGWCNLASAHRLPAFRFSIAALLLVLTVLLFSPTHLIASQIALQNTSLIASKVASTLDVSQATSQNTSQVASQNSSQDASSKSASADTTDRKGIIYFVFGSDSSTPGIHLRTKTANYRNTNFDLWRDPSRQTARSMDPAFRNRYVDSNGEAFRFTWWMQTGSLYRYATNTNMPYPSLMSLYLMNKYQMDNILAHGDEYTYHYHTWVWSDATGDGIYWWNQTPDYINSREDFILNLAEALIEEDMFPVSFRSGWHFMDNDWQADLDDWMPFSLHNAWPANAVGSPEPVNNIYVWNEAPSDWVPFQPRSDNYQLPGGNRGWNTRSIHFRSVRDHHIRQMFEAAEQGIDQVPCIWSHVAENTFIRDFEDVFERIERISAEFPEIEYRYDTAVEAMQRWLGSDDRTPPELSVDRIPEGDGYRVRVRSNEELFQPRPFLAAKDIYERHRRVEMVQTGELEWISEEIFTPSNAARWSIAVTDTVGNQTKYHARELPDDLYLDDEGEGFSVEGNWQTVRYNELDPVWGQQARVYPVNPTEGSVAGVSATWHTVISEAAHYDVFIRFPNNPGVQLPGEAGVTRVPFQIAIDGEVIHSDTLRGARMNSWEYLFDADLRAGQTVTVRITPPEQYPNAGILVADAVKLSAYRPPVRILEVKEHIHLGSAVRGESVDFHVELTNRGYEEAAITGTGSSLGLLRIEAAGALVIPAYGSMRIPVSIDVGRFGSIRDTLLIQTSDPGAGAGGRIAVPVAIVGKTPFTITDNEDEELYSESGTWSYSVAQAVGHSSRFAMINAANAAAVARFSAKAPNSGWQAVSYIVPSASNSALRADYTVSINSEVALQRTMDQNTSQTEWSHIGRILTMENDYVEIAVSLPDTDQPGRVLRADAVQLESMGPELEHLIVDNETTGYYSETGPWSNSVSRDSWGSSSRFATTADAQATWTVGGIAPGLIELSIYLPKTENAAVAARYSIWQDGFTIGNLIIDQNPESGGWRPIGTFVTGSDAPVEITVDYADRSNRTGVLRADAVRLTFDPDGMQTSAGNDPQLPDRFELSQNFPNPFNPVTTIRFTLGREQSESPVRLVVYDVLGREVVRLAEGWHAAGAHQVQFDGGNLASGVYIYRLETAAGTLSRKMLLLK